MMATIHQLHPPSPALAGFLRIGHTGQQKLEELHAAGRFPYRGRQLYDLSIVPEGRRAEHFVLRHLEPALRSARLGGKLKILDDSTRRVLDDARKRLAFLRDALDDLDSRGGLATRSRPLALRGGGGAVSAVIGR